MTSWRLTVGGSGLPEEDAHFVIPIGGEHVALSLVDNMGPKVFSHNDVPAGSELLIEVLLNFIGDHVLASVVVESLRYLILSSLSHVVVHVDNLDLEQFATHLCVLKYSNLKL